MSNKTGRPKAEIDWAVVDNYLKAQCDGTEIAEFFGIAPITLYRACEREYNVTFEVYKQQKRATGKMMLRAKQYQVAMSGDKSMLIWLGKQYLLQKDKSDVTSNDESITVQFVNNANSKD